jgi:hypothetical protein
LTGINQDGKTILLGVSLLQREDARSFEWAFEKFAESMSDGSSDDSAGGGDWRPDTIFTDSDVAMGAAIKRVWQGLTLVHFSAQRERFLWDLPPPPPPLKAPPKKLGCCCCSCCCAWSCY